MANQYVDAGIMTAKESMTVTDGSALTLTNDVRVLYDDALDTVEVYNLIRRIADRILKQEG